MLELLVFNKELCCEVYIRKRGFFMLHEIGLAALILIARRFENSANKKKHASEAWCFFLFALFIRDPERIRTSNRQSRNLIFYPVELLGRFCYTSFERTIFDIVFPSAFPESLTDAIPITFPISFIP